MDFIKQMHKRVIAYELFGLKKKEKKQSNTIMEHTTPEQRKAIANKVKASARKCFNALSKEQKRGLALVSDPMYVDDFIDGEYDTIAVLGYDMWDFAKAIGAPNARELGDLDTPIWDAMGVFMKAMKQDLDSLHLPNISFQLSNDGGDWDDGSVDVKISYTAQ